MNQSHTDIEKHLADAIESITPDVLSQILLTIEKGEDPTMNTTIIDHAPNVIQLNQTTEKKKTQSPWIKRLTGIAAAFVLVTGLYSGYTTFTPQAVIGFDVNPSIELTVNRKEQVIDVKALNEDANIILSDMDLNKVDLDVAVNALIGSMVKNGYLSEIKNSILVSVDSQNQDTAAQLQKRISAEVDALLQGYSLEGAVLSQSLTEDDGLKALATEHNISLGKASLIRDILDQDDTLTFDSLASLSINDINLILSARHTQLQSVASYGTASAGAYIGEEKAKSIANTHAGCLNPNYTKIEMDYDDGRMIYELSFYSNKMEYEYEIDALTGEVLGYDHDIVFSTAKWNQDVSTNASISSERALEIALSHAGRKASEVQVVSSSSYTRQGRSICKFIFTGDTNEYIYEVDTTSGDVFTNSCHAIGNGYGNGNPSGYGHGRHQQGHTATIGTDSAKSIALNHAGVSADTVYDWDIDLDNDDGYVVYEIDFYSGNKEYEYEINAITGEIIWWDSEIDD